MRASVAMPLLYARVTRGLSESARLEVDALLALPGAVARRDAARRAAVAEAHGFEVG